MSAERKKGRQRTDGRTDGRRQADVVRQDRSSGSLSRVGRGRVKLWDRKEGRKEGRKDREEKRAGGKNCAVQGDRDIAVAKSLLQPHSITLLHSDKVNFQIMPNY